MSSRRNCDTTCFVMVGLPARGKSSIARKLARYLNWIGVHTQTFNAGNYRRQIVATEDCRHEFFDAKNENGNEVRRRCVDLALADVESFLKENGQVAILDASNSTVERRAHIYNRCKMMGVKTFFIESICNDQEVIQKNIVQVKSASPDYVNCSEDDAVADFIERIRHYEDQYQPIDVTLEQHLSFLKIIDVGNSFFIHRVTGYTQSRAIFFLMNTNVSTRSIYLSRHGESMFNIARRVGGNSELSARGRQYRRKLAHFLKSRGLSPHINLWTSTLKRTIETGELIETAQRTQWEALDEINVGICDNLTYEEIEEQYPEEFALRKADKFNYRYPRGESYYDVVLRLEKVILELERQTDDVMCICHQAVVRCLLAYFLEIDSVQLPFTDIPLHTVFQLTPGAYGWTMKTFCLDEPCVPASPQDEVHHVDVNLQNQVNARGVVTEGWSAALDRSSENEGEADGYLTEGRSTASKGVNTVVMKNVDLHTEINEVMAH